MLRAKISAFLFTFFLLFSSTITPIYRARARIAPSVGRFASARLQGTRIGARLKQSIAGQKRNMFSGQFFFEAARTGTAKLLGLGSAAGALAGTAAYEALTENSEATKRVYKAIDRVIQEGGTLATLATNNNLPEDIRKNLSSPVVQSVLEYLKKMGRGASTIPASVIEQMGPGFSLAAGASQATASSKAVLDGALQQAKAKFERDLAEAAAKRLAQQATEAAAKTAAQQVATTILPSAGAGAAGAAKAVLAMPPATLGAGVASFARQVHEATELKSSSVAVPLFLTAAHAAYTHQGTTVERAVFAGQSLARGVAVTYATAAFKLGGVAAVGKLGIALPAGKVGVALAMASPIAAGVAAAVTVGVVVKKAPAIKNYIWGSSKAETVSFLEEVAAIDRACALTEQARQEAEKKLAEMATREAAEKAAKELAERTAKEAAEKGFLRRAIDTLAENKGKATIGLLVVAGGYVAYHMFIKDGATPSAPSAAKPTAAPAVATRGAGAPYAWPAAQPVAVAPAAPAAAAQPAVETKRAEAVRAEAPIEQKEKFVATYEKARVTADNYKTVGKKVSPLYPHDSLPRSAAIPGTTDRMALCRTGRWVDIYELQSPATPTTRAVYNGHRIPLEEYDAVAARGRAAERQPAAGAAAQQQAPATAAGGGAPRDPRENKDNDKDKHPHGKYEDNPKHHPNSRGNISKPPKNGPEVFKNSIEAGPGRRIGLENGKLVEFQEHTPGTYHGYVIDSLEAFKNLNPNVMKALRKAKWINGKKFRILKK